MKQSNCTKPHSLVVQFLVDTSASMYGAPLQAVCESMTLIYSILWKLDAHLSNNISISVVTFKADVPEVISNSTLPDFVIPAFTVSGLSSIKRTLAYIFEVSEQSPCPLICLLTDGDFTDIDHIVTNHHASLQIPLLAIACGLQANPVYLSNLTPYVFFSSQLTLDKLQEILDRYLHQSL